MPNIYENGSALYSSGTTLVSANRNYLLPMHEMQHSWPSGCKNYRFNQGEKEKGTPGRSNTVSMSKSYSVEETVFFGPRTHGYTNDPQALNRTFVLCHLYFCFCLELSPLVMNRHLLIQIWLLQFWLYCTNRHHKNWRFWLKYSNLQQKYLFIFQPLCKNNTKNEVFGELSNFALIGAKCQILK